MTLLVGVEKQGYGLEACACSCQLSSTYFSEVWYTLAVMSTVFATPIHDDSVPPRSLSQAVVSLYRVFRYMQICVFQF